jgi:peptidoglycan/LPS O-acetylase OafA/YrhL
MSLAYRKEIDGLRAVAVGAVVLYHAGLVPAAGFVGVDVFFAISGYLITALLLREHASAGRIDLADFYARRARRILPAAFAVIAFVLACIPLLPAFERAGIARSAGAAVLFVANFYFQASTGGYWHADSGQMPLLHLWSLSVEEQFYLVWPALLMLLLRWKLRVRTALALIAVGSFALCEWWLWQEPSAAFYQAPARAWELAAGALVAASAPRALPAWVSWAGIALVGAACLVPLPHFPGAGALPAVAGTVMLLASVHGGGSNALLASRPFVGIGLVSYSLYLWHWPLFAIERMFRVGATPLAMRVALLLLATLLAFLSYRLVETPLRRPWARWWRPVAAALAVVMLLSAWSLQRPEPPRYSAAYELAEVDPNYPTHCHSYRPGQRVQMQLPACMGRQPKVAIWGDSFARAWSPLATALGDRLRMPAVTLAMDGCPPLLGAELLLRSRAEAQRCRQWNDVALQYLRTNGADTLVLVARWENFIGADGGASSAEGLMRTLHLASPHVRRILLVGPTPVLPETPQKCAALGSDCAVPRAEYDARTAQAWAVLRAIDNPKVTVVDPSLWLCSRRACPGFREGAALYTDAFHVSTFTAEQVGREVASGWD